MIHPHNFEEKIGFDKVRELLRKQCLSPLGARHAEDMHFEDTHTDVLLLLDRTDEFRKILLSGQSFPNAGYFDLTHELKRTMMKGTYMDPESLFDLKSSLQTINEILYFFRDHGEEYPVLSGLTGSLEPRGDLLREIERIIDDKGGIRDNASPALQDIRDSLRRKQGAIDGRIRKSMQAARKAGFSPEDGEVTIRNGRMVIPILASSKRQVQGFIHDESASGQTVFIEPAEVFDLNNEIRDLENAERREILRILIAFTDLLRPEIPVLLSAYEFLGEVDFIRAKAKLALVYGGIRPSIMPSPLFNWRNARHPLLMLALKEHGKQVVPMDLELDSRNRILVISGPNAGGKSICLKTAGLLQYMIQCGLLVPMEENSGAGIFKDILLDIGDEQSLENDLSTYSSHLLNIKTFLEKGGRNTLFLIDEFGTGTEPHLGGAIAEAALHALNRQKAFGVVTTHYANIKLMADREQGIVNGAMLFDTNEMRPLYILRTGKPGSSFAFEIARKTGFPDEVLHHAASITGYSQVDFEKQLQELETEKMQLEKEKEKYGVADTFLSEMIDKYEKLIGELNSRKADILDKARREAADILSGANRVIERTIKEIREAEAEREKTKALRQKMKDEAEELVKNDEHRTLNKEQGNKEQRNKEQRNKEQVNKEQGNKEQGNKEQGIKKEGDYLKGLPGVGDWVEITTYGTMGEVHSIKGKNATVMSGSMKISVPLTSLKKIRRDENSGSGFRKSRTYGNIMSDINERAAKFKPTIDLRGKRAIEALDELKAYMDNAILLSVKEVTILHGKGDGILRSVLREYLRTVEDVESISDAHVERGGQGITIVRLK